MLAFEACITASLLQLRGIAHPHPRCHSGSYRYRSGSLDQLTSAPMRGTGMMRAIDPAGMALHGPRPDRCAVVGPRERRGKSHRRTADGSARIAVTGFIFASKCLCQYQRGRRGQRTGYGRSRPLLRRPIEITADAAERAPAQECSRIRCRPTARWESIQRISNCAARLECAAPRWYAPCSASAEEIWPYRQRDVFADTAVGFVRSRRSDAHRWEDTTMGVRIPAILEA